MESADRTPAHRGPDCATEQARTIPFLAAFAAAYLVTLMVLRFVPLPRAGQIAVALVPVPVFGVYIMRWVRAVRALDELQRLMTLEALAIAYPMALLLVLTVGLLEASGAMHAGAITYLQLWPMVFWLYFVGLFIARKRYR